MENNLHENKYKHRNALQMIMDVLRYFSTAQGTQAQTLAINIHHSSDKSRQAGVVRERRVTEKQCCLVRNLLKSAVLSKKQKSTWPFFTVKIAGSRDRKKTYEGLSHFVD